MLFSSSVFLFAFLPGTILIYFILRRLFTIKISNAFLFLVSLFFYAWGEPLFVGVMVLSIVLNYAAGLLLVAQKNLNKKRVVLASACIANLSILFIFKYLNFITENIDRIAPGGFPVTNILLPIGISFFTFQGMSYVFDVYRGEEVQHSLINVGLYIAFFPQLIAGPIVRYQTISQQINHRRETLKAFSEGTCRFLRGLYKKVLIANTLAVVADAAFIHAIPGETSVSFSWLGALSYSFQIFFDFAGYSDMAIGLGLMFGFHFSENFNYPYIAGTVSDFWRRWHISLTSWFRDYIYFPLGGSRVNKIKWLRNLLVVWLLTGIWHGANWTFILWGLFYFILQAIEKTTGISAIIMRSKAVKLLYRIFTLLCIIIAWVLFRSADITSAWNYICNMFTFSSKGAIDPLTIRYLHNNWVWYISAILFSTPIARYANSWLSSKGKIVTAIVETVRIAIYLFLLLLVISQLVMDAYNPFIYFNF